MIKLILHREYKFKAGLFFDQNYTIIPFKRNANDYLCAVWRVTPDWKKTRCVSPSYKLTDVSLNKLYNTGLLINPFGFSQEEVEVIINRLEWS